MVMTPVAFAADFGVRAGRYNDGENTFVGAEVAWDMGRVTLNPNIEYIVDDEVDTAGTANFDVLFNFNQGATIQPWLGAGLGVFYVDTDLGDDTDPVVNVVGGIGWNLDFLKPYAQVKYFRSLDDSETDDIALTIGLRF
jgi:opacity protein-like surface antigen